jgi:hypothetical protein
MDLNVARSRGSCRSSASKRCSSSATFAGAAGSLRSQDETADPNPRARRRLPPPSGPGSRLTASRSRRCRRRSTVEVPRAWPKASSVPTSATWISTPRARLSRTRYGQESRRAGCTAAGKAAPSAPHRRARGDQRLDLRPRSPATARSSTCTRDGAGGGRSSWLRRRREASTPRCEQWCSSCRRAPTT